MNPLKVLESDSFILGLLLMIAMLVFFKELVGVLAVMAFLGLSLQGVLLVILDIAMLITIPSMFYKWAPLVDGEKK